MKDHQAGLNANGDLEINFNFSVFKQEGVHSRLVLWLFLGHPFCCYSQAPVAMATDARDDGFKPQVKHN